MPILRLLQNAAFDPETTQIILSAYESTRNVLQLVDRSDPLTEIVARKIIQIAQTGERDPDRIRALALRSLQGGTQS